MNRRFDNYRSRITAPLLRAVSMAALACLFAVLSDSPPWAGAQFGSTPPRQRPSYRYSVEDREAITARGLAGWSAEFNQALAVFRKPIQTAEEHLDELHTLQAAKQPDQKKIAELKTALAADRAILAALKTRTAELAALDKTPGLLDSGRSDGPFAALAKKTLISRPHRVDLNADGRPDIVAASHYSGILIWLDDGKGGWTASTLSTPDQDRISNIAIGDVNADGVLDIVGTYSRSFVLIHLADGKGGWKTQPMDASMKGLYATNLALADIDGDKKTDVILLPGSSGKHQTGGPIFYRGSGGGRFHRTKIAGFGAVENSAYYRGSEICVTDLNADGNNDLVIAHDGRIEGGHVFDVAWFGDGGKNFVSASIGLSFGRLAWETFACAEVADFNADGQPDIIMGCMNVSEHEPHGIQACLGNGHGVWRSANEGLPPDAVTDIETADIDGDGNLDIAAATKDRLMVALGDGAGHWRMLPPVSLEDRRKCIVGINVADIDGDGRPDIMAAMTSGRVSTNTPGMSMFGGQQPDSRSQIRVWLNRPAGAALKKRIDRIDAAVAALGIAPAPAVAAPKVPPIPQVSGATTAKVDETKMLPLLASRYYDDRLTAMLALLDTDATILPKIRKGLEHQNPQMRASCLDLLALKGDTEAFARIAALAEDAEEAPLVRRHALRALELLDPLGTHLAKLGGTTAAKIRKAVRDNDPDGTWKYEIEEVLLPLFVNYGVIDTAKYDEIVAKIKIDIKNDIADGKIKDALRRCQEVFGYSRGALEPSAYDKRVLTECPADREIEKIVLDNIEEYRRLYDIKAQIHLEHIRATGNSQALSEFLWQYSYTTIAPQALATLVATEYERCAYLKVVMDWHRYPWLHDRATLTTRLTVLASLLEFGLQNEANALAKDLAADYPAASVRIRGADMPLADYVKSLFENSGAALPRRRPARARIGRQPLRRACRAARNIGRGALVAAPGRGLPHGNRPRPRPGNPAALGGRHPALSKRLQMYFRDIRPRPRRRLSVLSRLRRRKTCL